MRRNVRNITLVGVAALVLGGVAVASSGRFDSADDTAASSAGGAVRRLRRTSDDDPRVRAGGCQARERPGRERAQRPHRCRHSRETRRRVPRVRRTSVTAPRSSRRPTSRSRWRRASSPSVSGGEPHRNGERRIRRQLVDLDDGLPGQPDPGRRHERSVGLGQPGAAPASSRSGCRPRSSTPRELRCPGSAKSTPRRSTGRTSRASSSTWGLASRASRPRRPRSRRCSARRPRSATSSRSRTSSSTCAPRSSSSRPSRRT